jgi:precorrin-8X/cobalt-precorrin-8 methylmutase
VELEYIAPEDIERRSFAIIAHELGEREFAADIAPIVKRVIHTTADFDYADTLCFSPDAVQSAITALLCGAHIVTDTQMALSGVNKRALASLGGEAHCFMADGEVAVEAKRQGVTRASVCMERAALFTKPLIIAVGNAPTALIRLYELMREGRISPALIVGAPVGFVNVVEAKELILRSGTPHIVARGRKGGSTVAAAIVNALLLMAQERRGQE